MASTLLIAAIAAGRAYEALDALAEMIRNRAHMATPEEEKEQLRWFAAELRATAEEIERELEEKEDDR